MTPGPTQGGPFFGDAGIKSCWLRCFDQIIARIRWPGSRIHFPDPGRDCYLEVTAVLFVYILDVVTSVVDAKENVKAGMNDHWNT